MRPLLRFATPNNKWNKDERYEYIYTSMPRMGGQKGMIDDTHTCLSGIFCMILHIVVLRQHTSWIIRILVSILLYIPNKTLNSSSNVDTVQYAVYDRLILAGKEPAYPLKRERGTFIIWVKSNLAESKRTWLSYISDQKGCHYHLFINNAKQIPEKNRFATVFFRMQVNGPFLGGKQITTQQLPYINNKHKTSSIHRSRRVNEEKRYTWNLLLGPAEARRELHHHDVNFFQKN